MPFSGRELRCAMFDTSASKEVVWTPDPSGRARKGLGNNFARKCLEHWNAAVGVDEGKNAFQPTSV